MRHPPFRGARMTVHMSYTSFPRTQGEAPSQYYVPLAGFFVNKYLSSLQLLKHLIFVFIFIFEIHVYDPHTISRRKFLHICDPQTGNIADFPVKNVSKFIVELTHMLHKIFKTFLKNSVLKCNFEGHIGDPQNASKMVASPRASPPSFPRICTKHS